MIALPSSLLCDRPNTFQLPGAPFHGPSARAWGCSFLAQLRTFSNCVSVWCQVVGGQREEESNGNSPHTPGTTVPLNRERDSPTCTVLDDCPAPPAAASAGLTAGWTGENEKRGKIHSEHRSSFSWSSGQKVRTLILKIFCPYQCVLLGSGLPLCHVILERGTQETHNQFGGTSNSHLLPQAACYHVLFRVLRAAPRLLSRAPATVSGKARVEGTYTILLRIGLFFVL